MTADHGQMNSRGGYLFGVAFAWPSFWWLESYPRFADYLRSRFPCLWKSERLTAFDLTRPHR